MGKDDDDDPGHNQDQYKLNGKIMLTAILSLTFVIVLVVLLHIYARCALRRQARRRAALYRLTIANTAAQVQSREPPKTGLDPSVIAALPIFIYKHNGQLDDAAAVAECAVCLSTIEEEEMVRLLPNCNHTFHAQCIDMWLSSHSTCPICRAEAEPQPPPNPHDAAIEVLPTAPPLNSMTPCSEDASDGAAQCSKVGGSSSRLSSFRRMLSRERSERRLQPLGQTDGVGDLERQ